MTDGTLRNYFILKSIFNAMNKHTQINRVVRVLIVLLILSALSGCVFYDISPGRVSHIGTVVSTFVTTVCILLIVALRVVQKDR